MIIDDSELVRQALKNIFASDERFEVMAVANDPYDAVQKLKLGVPDVITLDVEMPKMDGITFLKKLMKQHPIPVVVISTLTKKGTTTALRALEYGAVEVMHKPNVSTGYELDRNATYIRNAIKAASHANVTILNKRLAVSRIAAKNAIESTKNNYFIQNSIASEKVLAIGASTGGTEAIKSILKELEHDSPGAVVVQHMPAMFTGQFAQRLNNECSIIVKEATHRDRIIQGRALIAPGDHHMLVKKDSKGFYIELSDGELVNRHRPSVDVLFNSIAQHVGKNAVGTLLTGMGKDGAEGLLAMRQSGSFTLAQNESSCVVFGMPKEAISLNAAEKVLHLDEMGVYLKKIKNSK